MDDKVMKIAVFPWLATGHFIPFFRLSKCLAEKGHKILFISTPKNLQNLPKIPHNLSHLISFTSIPLPHLPNLPHHTESSSELPYNKQQTLKKAFDLLQNPIQDFLETCRPDWIIYDYASHWLPSMAAKLGISRAFFSLFTAATLAFIGPPEVLINGRDLRTSAKDFTVVPSWIPFESNMVFRLHEVTKHVDSNEENESGTTDTARYGAVVEGSNVVVVRSIVELEPEWFGLLNELYRKPVIALGCLHPVMDEIESDSEDENWVDVKNWLDMQETSSVAYVAFGTEAPLSQDEVNELAIGLEGSKLPFVWVLRNSVCSSLNMIIPNGFEEKVRGRGYVYKGWAPQVKILSHGSVGGFLTHCGWNSVIEGLGYGKVLVLLPVLNEQGLNSRLLEAKRLGVEVPRNEEDGSFTCESIAKSIRLAMVDEAGEPLRVKAMEMKELFGDKARNSSGVDGFVDYLQKNKPPPIPL